MRLAQHPLAPGTALASVLAGVLVVAFVVVGATAARAMTVPAYTATELAAMADLVVEGTVQRARAQLVGRRVITFYVVEYDDGARRASTLVAIPGGDFGRWTQRVPGAPRLEVGRRYRLHLGKAEGPRDGDSPPARGVVGFFRGVVRLDPIADGGYVVVPFGEDGLATGRSP